MYQLWPISTLDKAILGRSGDRLFERLPVFMCAISLVSARSLCTLPAVDPLHFAYAIGQTAYAKRELAGSACSTIRPTTSEGNTYQEKLKFARRRCDVHAKGSRRLRVKSVSSGNRFMSSVLRATFQDLSFRAAYRLTTSCHHYTK